MTLVVDFNSHVVPVLFKTGLLNEEQGRLILGENAAKLLHLESAAEVSHISHASFRV